jgi:hypothetical protein
VLHNCLMAKCQGKTCDNSFRLDRELVYRIIRKSCIELESEALKNGVITDDVAGSRSTKNC